MQERESSSVCRDQKEVRLDISMVDSQGFGDEQVLFVKISKNE